jgi:hypothetical protein
MIPGEVHVTIHADEDEKHRIAIFTSKNAEGIVGASIGLMDRNQSRNPAVQVFTEVLMDARGENSIIGNVLGTIGCYIIKNGWKAGPGVVFEKMIDMYAPDLAVKHVLFTPPFQWKDGMTKVQLSKKTIYPLLAVPITDAERAYAASKGAEALEERWERDHTDVLDWQRH